MKISQKLTLIVAFACAVTLLVGYQGSKYSQQFLHKEIERSSALRAQSILNEMTRALKAHVIEWEAFRHDPEIQQALITSNEKFSKLSSVEAHMQQMDKEWRNSKEDFHLAKDLISNSVSKKLRLWSGEFKQELGYELFPEIFITNKYGANIAQTGMTSDYVQNDEAWWQKGFEEGLFISDVEFDESAGQFSIPVCIRVDDNQGNILGVMKVIIGLQEAAQILVEAELAEDEEMTLFDGEGRVVKTSMNSKKQALENYQAMLSVSDSFNRLTQVERFDSATQEKIFSTAKRLVDDGWFKNLDWVILIEKPARTLFREQTKLAGKLNFINLLASIILLVLSGIMSFSIKRRLTNLSDLTAGLARGEYEGKTESFKQDEIGGLEKSFFELSVELEASNKLFKQMAESAPVFIWMTSEEGDCTYVNQEWLNFSGGTFEEQIAGGWVESIHLDDKAKWWEGFKESLASRKRFDVDSRLKNSKGEYRWISCTAVPRIREDGSFAGFIGSGFEIHNRKIAEDAVEKQSARMQALYEISADSSLNYQEQVVKTLETVCRHLDLDIGIVSSVAGETYTVDHVYAPDADLSVGQQFELGSTYCSITLDADDVVAINETASSEYSGHPCYQNFGLESYIGTPIYLQGSVVGTLNFSSPESRESTFRKTDIEFVRLASHFISAILERMQHRVSLEKTVSDLAESNKALESARENAEEATKAKSDFLASMSHELRTPMNSIMGFTQRLIKNLGASLSERDLDALQTVDRNSKHLLGLINDILDLSKIEAGKMSLNKTPFDLTGVIKGVAATLDPLAEQKQLKMTCMLPEGGIQVLGDRTKFTQILTNLISNAIKYTDSGFVEIEARALELDGQVEVSVKDSGIGISAEDLGKLFTKFTQLDREERRRKGGTGLGLTIAKEYLEMHEGEIEVESILGEGSKFTLTAPILVKQKEQQAFNAASDDDMEDASLKILCVDDDPDVLKFLKLTFEDEGYKVALASSHDEAICAFKDSKPDLICLDICMPEKTGYDVLETLRGVEGSENVPVVVVSAIADLKLPKEGKVTCYLPKPVDTEKLHQVVRRSLAKGVDNVLLVEDCDDTAKLLEHSISECEIAVSRAVNGKEALSILDEKSFSAIILDLMMPEMDGFEFLEEFNKRPESKATSIFILTAKKLDSDEIALLGKSSEAILTKGRDSTTELIDTILLKHKLQKEEIEKCQ